MSDFERFTCRVVEVRVAANAGDDINVIEGIAQVYDQMNDRQEVFLPNAFAGNEDRVAAGRCKICDSHIWTAEDTHGVMTYMEDRQSGLYFRAKWSAATNSQNLKTKMIEGIVDEFSIEFCAINEEFKTVDGAPQRVISKAFLNGLGLLPYSSQGVPAIISVRNSFSLDKILAEARCGSSQTIDEESLLTSIESLLPLIAEEKRVALLEKFATRAAKRPHGFDIERMQRELSTFRDQL